MKLLDKVVVITGSGSGIGEACAHRFAAEGARVVATGHPLLKTAATPAEVADRLVAAIDAERFLILDSQLGQDLLSAKAADYEEWTSTVIPQNS